MRFMIVVLSCLGRQCCEEPDTGVEFPVECHRISVACGKLVSDERRADTVPFSYAHLKDGEENAVHLTTGRFTGFRYAGKKPSAEASNMPTSLVN